MAQRRFDPERRDRIIDAALDVIAEHGVAGASHRKIAAQADVPLGSMTYHFSGMEDLLHGAFTRFSTAISARFEAGLLQAHTLEEAREAVVDLIHEDLNVSARELVLTQELYTLAARDAAYRAITHAWMRQSRTSLARHFDPVTCRMLDALIEGSFLHAALDTEQHDRAVTAEAVARITTPVSSRDH
ncbi:TetR/AcrR family transcriptional regulator [Arthrobacter oryzae]|uniref:TetR/AcrR family transcriptional regulator n=1 Tax=Arthrobacter oryzae TaxID=409290 RepID=UPI00278A721B|nr:TetR family transcriptional regulator [Arthrobacter oryzae]MDQ0077961.1 DNA-binding transcriptional regulator YbjK [Arthrobacter oryzae]